MRIIDRKCSTYTNISLQWMTIASRLIPWSLFLIKSDYFTKVKMILMPNIHVIQMCCCHPCLLLDLMAISPRLLLYTEITITTVFTTEFNCTMFIFTSVPGEPRNVAARPLNSSSIVVTWNAPEDEEKHGIIRGYQIYVQPRKSVSADIHSSRN